TNKNIQCLLSAIKLLADDHDLHLEVIGDGPERSRLEGFSMDLGISSRISFSGQIDQAEIAEALRRADIFVLASFSEGRPNVLVEAMAAGMPIIASNIDGVRELINEGVNGLLFDPKDPTQLEKQIRCLCDTPGLKARLAYQARRYVIENGLSWTEAAMRYASLYQSTVHSH
ncbi:partial D-inositol 3-phosphate glycosyltransferase, partial [Methylococcales bacterium]